MKRVAVTRPRIFLKDTVAYMRSKGLEAVPVPMMELIPREDAAVDASLERIRSGQADAVILTSQNGVRFLSGRSSDFAAILNGVEVYAIGPKTNKALTGAGVKAAAMPSTFSSEGLVMDFCKKLSGKRVEVLRSDHGNPILMEGLRESGANAIETVVYDIVPLKGGEQEAFVLEALEGRIDAFTFTSIMTAKSLLMVAESMGKKDELKAVINSKKVAVIGNPTASFLKDNGIRVDVLPGRFTFEDMIEGLLKVI